MKYLAYSVFMATNEFMSVSIQGIHQAAGHFALTFLVSEGRKCVRFDSPTLADHARVWLIDKATGGQARPSASGGGFPVWQESSARRQRGWNVQPDGRSAGLGGSLGVAGGTAPAVRRGTDASSACV